MELKLEGILETLLVGAIASLVILSLIFFLFGHIWNVPVMRRFFDILFGERGADETERHIPPSDASPLEGATSRLTPSDPRLSTSDGPSPRRARVKAREHGDESHLSFVLILLLALLYGLGIIAEGSSHLFRLPDDSEVKRTSFRAVAHGQIHSNTATRQLARFISDYDACLALPKTKAVKGGPPSLCEQLDVRVLEFFHNAKNAVLQNHEFYDELSALEGRINFMRSFYILTRILVFELGVVFIIAAIAEYGHSRYAGVWRRWSKSLFPGGPWREWRHAMIGMGRHWVNIAAFHCLLLFLAASGLYFLARGACDFSEDQFAKRIFGYYLSLAPDRAAHRPPPGIDGDNDPLRDVTPESPYHMFSLPESTDEAFRSHGQRRLEPSAIQILGHTSRVLVASDQGGPEPFWLFTLNDDGTHLVAPTPISVYPGGRKLLQAKNIEALAIVETQHVGTPDVQTSPKIGGRIDCRLSPGYDPQASDQKLVEVIAAPAVFPATSPARNPPPTGTLLSFCIDPDDKAPTIKEMGQESIPSPCATLDPTKDCRVEGIAFRDQGRELLLGIQRVGTASKAAIVSLTLDAKGEWKAPRKIFPADGDKCGEGRCSPFPAGTGGISDLAMAPSGRIYVTTSIERDSSNEMESPGADASDAISQVGGALWLVDLDCASTPLGQSTKCRGREATLLETFVHKPDGLSPDEGSVLVVFDDEARRKSPQWAPKTFPLAQDESVFVVVPSPEFKR